LAVELRDEVLDRLLSEPLAEGLDDVAVARPLCRAVAKDVDLRLVDRAVELPDRLLQVS